MHQIDFGIDQIIYFIERQLCPHAITRRQYPHAGSAQPTLALGDINEHQDDWETYNRKAPVTPISSLEIFICDRPGQKEPHTSLGEVIVLDTLEAAESEVGTQIHTPSHIPAGFEGGKIFVSRFDTRGQEPVVLQTWRRKSDGAFFFIQESSTLAGFAGEASDATLGTKQVRYSASVVKMVDFSRTTAVSHS